MTLAACTRSRAPIRLAILTLSVAFACGSHAQSPKPAPKPGMGKSVAQGVIEGDVGRALDASVMRFDSDAGGFCGTVLVAAGGKVLLEKGYGMADAAAKKAMPSDALFDWASVTKQFTAAAVLRLQDKKKLKLDDTLARHWKDAPKNKAGVTLRQLLNHTSGIEAGFKKEWSFDARSRESFEKLAIGLPMTSKPGEAFEYSNSGYALAAAIVERVSGKTWEEFLVDDLFKPAGMKDACCIGWKTLDRARVPKIDRGMGFTDRPADFSFAYGNELTWGYRGCGGVVATAHDMFLWDRALRGEKILSKAAREEYYRVGLKDYALGWEVRKSDLGDRVEHSGGVLGVVTYYLRLLEKDVVVAIACSYSPKDHPGTLAEGLARKAIAGG